MTMLSNLLLAVCLCFPAKTCPSFPNRIEVPLRVLKNACLLILFILAKHCRPGKLPKVCRRAKINCQTAQVKNRVKHYFVNTRGTVFLLYSA